MSGWHNPKQIVCENNFSLAKIGFLVNTIIIFWISNRRKRQTSKSHGRKDVLSRELEVFFWLCCWIHPGPTGKTRPIWTMMCSWFIPTFSRVRIAKIRNIPSSSFYTYLSHSFFQNLPAQHRRNAAGLLGTALVAVMGVIIMALPRLRMLSSNATLAVSRWRMASHDKQRYGDKCRMRSGRMNAPECVFFWGKGGKGNWKPSIYGLIQ